MEAKDTVLKRDEVSGYTFGDKVWDMLEELLLFQAEISFKAGYEKCAKELEMYLLKWKQEGRREVLDWEEEHNVIGYVYDTDDPEVEKQNMIDHANQLKKWGLL